MKLSQILPITFITAVMLTMMSCRDELCYDHYPSVALSLSWEREWERDYGKNHADNWNTTFIGFDYNEFRPALPEWVNIVRFSTDGYRYEHYVGNQGDRIIMDEGDSQSLLLYNGDTEYIILSDIATPPEARASATGRSRSSLSYITEKHPSARTTSPPDALYAAFIPDISDVQKHEIRPISVKMQPLVYTYIIRYEFDYGNEHIALARGALGGMAESVYLLDGRTSGESAIILFDCELTDYGCIARVGSFGVPDFPDKYFGRADSETAPQPYTLNLEVRLNNGKYVEFNTDISNQIANQPRGGVIHVSGLRIDDGDSFSDAGFNVDVDGWGDRVDIDLPVSPSK